MVPCSLLLLARSDRHIAGGMLADAMKEEANAPILAFSSRVSGYNIETLIETVEDKLASSTSSLFRTPTQQTSHTNLNFGLNHK